MEYYALRHAKEPNVIMKGSRCAKECSPPINSTNEMKCGRNRSRDLASLTSDSQQAGKIGR